MLNFPNRFEFDYFSLVSSLIHRGKNIFHSTGLFAVCLLFVLLLFSQYTHLKKRPKILFILSHLQQVEFHALVDFLCQNKIFCTSRILHCRSMNSIYNLVRGFYNNKIIELVPRTPVKIPATLQNEADFAQYSFVLSLLSHQC